MALADSLNRLSKFSRAGNWVPFLELSIVYVLIYLLFLQDSAKHIYDFLIFIAYQASVLAYMCIINSVADLKIDSAVGKNFGVSYFPRRFVLLLLFILAFAMVFVPVIFGFAPAVIGLAVFFLATFYSVGPVRLKAKGFAGVLAVSLAPVAMPFLLFVSIVSENVLFGIYLASVLFLKTMLNEAPHQIEDYGNDRKSGVKTWAVYAGKEKARNFIRAVLVVYLLWLLLSFGFGPAAGLLVYSVTLILSLQKIITVARL